MNATLQQQDAEEVGGFPMWGIIVLVIGIMLIISIIVYLLVRYYSRVSQIETRKWVRDDTLSTVMAERARLFADSDPL